MTIDSAWAEYRKMNARVCFHSLVGRAGDPCPLCGPGPCPVILIPFNLADLEAAFMAGAAVRGAEIEVLAREMIEEMRLTPDGLIVRESQDRSDAHYRLCSLLWPKKVRFQPPPAKGLTDTHRDPSRPSDGQKVFRDMASASVHVPVEDPARDGGGHPAGLQSGVPPQREGETGGVTRNAGAPCVASSPPAKEPQS